MEYIKPLAHRCQETLHGKSKKSLDLPALFAICIFGKRYNEINLNGLNRLREFYEISRKLKKCEYPI